MNWYYFSLGLAMILLLMSFIIAGLDDDYGDSIQEFLSFMFATWFMLCFLATLCIGGLALVVKGLG